MPPGNILIVDDHKRVRISLQMLLQDEFDTVNVLSNPKSLLSELQHNSYDIVLLDMNFSAGVNTGNEGLFWMNEILKYDPDLAVVLLTAYGDVELAVTAIKQGATDFVLKPWDNNKLISTLKSALSLRLSKKKIQKLETDKQDLTRELNQNKSEMIGRSSVMMNLRKLLQKVAITDANVLVLGEHGTGKELIAREIHQQSKRSNKPMVSVDMGAMSESLFESELFGHVKGAFTDAREDRQGRFELASGGTIFLDEIGNLSLAMQAKLLSVLQNREVIRVGDHQSRRIDIRLVCATNKNLQEMVAEGTFREDLLYRINTIQVDVPALRDRASDIVLLAEYFLMKYANKYDKRPLTYTDEVLVKLQNYPWPGNVRELQHAVEKAVILSEGDRIASEDFLLKQNEAQATNLPPQSFMEMEKQMILTAMERHDGNLTHMARELGVTRPTLYHKIKKYDL
ncbi:sigma-54-dependent Fis family transcriptional regulator [Marinifilum breve]|uniref:Sigma-54-dependent Fis family transcriptional regulator n=1 Tax=Marinifilum breve TaxID=2184082 RepID=A0A2V4AB94_9BACT|nr:sigma-54 dependent transcriptional regulator [Marinifilum breve]PXY01244.1 sigma-54-dependent Fis family transcriptional regulator [Marinifilum breve]